MSSNTSLRDRPARTGDGTFRDERAREVPDALEPGGFVSRDTPDTPGASGGPIRQHGRRRRAGPASRSRPVRADGPRTTHAHRSTGRAAALARGLRRRTVLWLWLALAVGLPIVALSFRVAIADPSSQTYYHLFWLGTLVAIVPPIVVVLSRSAQRRARQVALVAVAATLTTPVLLLRVGGPYYHDEFPHLREVQAILETGRLFQPVSIVPIASSFPGLHSLSAALALVSGAGPWVAGVLVVLTAHLLALLGIYVLGEQLSGTDRVGAIAALIYALNPSYLFFDSQFAYESLAICFFVWGLVFATAIGTTRPWRQMAAACLVAFACVATHHLTTLALLSVLVLLTLTRALATLRGGSKRVAAATLGLTLATVLFAAFWVVVVAPQTFRYLAPYPEAAMVELFNIANRSGSSRTLYAGTTAPTYERLMAFGTPILVALAACGGWLHALTRRTLTATTWAVYLSGMLYFPSVPLILTTSGAEGARRSWAYSYVGLAVLVAPWLVRLLDWRPRFARVAVRLGVPAAIVVLLIGNVSAGLNVYYRFPGPVTYGVETRSTTAETLAMARWLKETAGPGAKVVTDRITGLALGSTGAARLAIGSSGFRIWDLYTSNKPPPALLIRQLRSSDYQYLVIDKRLAVHPIQGAYFDGGAPQWKTLPPFTPADLSKFDSWSWTPKVYQSRNYAVYKFDFSQLPPSLAAATTTPTSGATR